MSLHDDLFADAVLPLQIELHGDSGRVTHTPPGGEASSLDAVVGPERTDEVPDDHGTHLECVREITVQTADATPLKASSFAVDGVTYAVRQIRSLGDSAVVVELVRRPMAEVSRRNLRGAR